MRVLFISNLYPPIVFGGYEVECSAVVDHLRENHEVAVLTSSLDRSRTPRQSDIHRDLQLLSPDSRGALRAPLAALGALAATRRALQWRPDLVYVWNASDIPHASLRAIADAGVPLAIRVCELWFARLFTGDQFMRELTPEPRSPPRAAWSALCRTLNRLPILRIDPREPIMPAISWNSQAIRRMVGTIPAATPVMERVIHSVPRFGDMYADVVRDPGPEPEIAFVGRVTHSKGVHTVLQALALLESEHGIKARFTVVGSEDDSYARQLRQLALSLGVDGQVNWHGPASPEQIAQIFSRTHALILPSIGAEAFPLVTIEGALARVPLIASDIGGTSEGMHDEEHALLFEPGSAPGAARALARTLSEADATAARVERANLRAQEFRLGPYLDAQERFVLDALEALSPGRQPVGSPLPG